MAGYDGFSKSNNAIAAENSGLMTATDAGRALGVSASAVAEVLSPAEWHHTSKFYRQTNYYDVSYILDPENTDEDEAEQGQQDLAAMREFDSQRKVEVLVYNNCEVEWLEWSGSRSYPRANERTATGCTVEWRRGAPTCTVIFPEGKKMRKGLETRGFHARFVRPATPMELAECPEGKPTRTISLTGPFGALHA